MKKTKLLYFFYNRLNDPLLQSNIVLYINALAETGLYDVAIITYEDKAFPLSNAEKAGTRNRLAAQGIYWYPLEWHAGSNLFLKSIDLVEGFIKLSWLARVKGYRHVISLGSIAGSFVYLFSKLVKIKSYLYQYEPHSEYALDNGLWSKDSRQYRLLHDLEKKSVMACTVVSSGTDNMRARLQDWQITAPFFKVSSVANNTLFDFSAEQRTRIRRSLNIQETQKLVIYPGKLGELYCSATQLVAVFKTLYTNDPAFRFIVITPNQGELDAALKCENTAFQQSVAVLPPLAYAEMPHYLSAADLGVVAVLPGPSKKFISNIKVGEYLCAGLPYLICRGISEDDAIAREHHTGIVVEDLTEQELVKALPKIKTLLQEPKSDIAARCRQAGIRYRGFNNQYAQYKLAIEALISEQN